MQNTRPAGPIGAEFESLVRLLPEWALLYEHTTIEKVRQALVHLEKEGKLPENLRQKKNMV